MSAWMWWILILTILVVVCVVLSLCLSAYMSSANASMRHDRADAQNRRDMEHAYDRAMRDAFEKQED